MKNKEHLMAVQQATARSLNFQIKQDPAII